jgi:hypothetical protein
LGLGLATQRLGLWVGGFPLAFSLLVMVGSLTLLGAQGALRIHWGRASAYYLVLATVTASALLNIDEASFPSYLLLLGLYAPLCLQTELSPERYRGYYAGVIWIAAALAVGGVAQYLLQFVVGNPELLFSWASFVPENLLIEYATLNKLSYESATLKSNGVVFLEASAFSQFLARAVLLALIVSVQRRWIPLLGIALLLTYSGTGMLVLAAFLPFALLSRRTWRGLNPRKAAPLFGLAVLAALASAAALSALGVFDLSLLLSRFDEVSAPGSSGYARYGSTPLILSQAFRVQSPLQLLFGLGPGATDQFLTGYSFEVFATAWVKLLVEYGLLGLVSVSAFLAVCLWTSTRSRVLSGAFLVQFLLLDGNLLVPQYVLLLMFLGALPTVGAALARPAVEARRPGPPATMPQSTELALLAER